MKEFKNITFLRYLFILLMLGLNIESFAQSTEGELSNTEKQESEPKGSILESDDALPLNARIISLLELSEEKPSEALLILPKIEALSDNFNAAEKYLMFIIRANILIGSNQEDKIIELLNLAIKLEKDIPKKQLKELIFSNLHLILTKAYAATKQYQLAYEQKSAYLDKYRAYRLAIKELRIKKLNEKYKTDLKLKTNELLQSQSEYKTLQIQEAKRQESTQQRNVIIVIVAVILFVVLLFRQLRIRLILRRLAKTDSLTGIFNRRTLFEQGEKLTTISIENTSQLSVILFDIDHFKLVNDTYGHDIGDSVIQSIAHLGSETMRSRDVFARLGGEEFAAILPGTSLDQAKAFAERFREKVESFNLTNHENSHRVTISAGVANLSQVEVDFDSLLHAADEAMYLAKNQGRNQVCSFSAKK